MDDLSKMSLEELGAVAALGGGLKDADTLNSILAELRRRDEERRVLIGHLAAAIDLCDSWQGEAGSVGNYAPSQPKEYHALRSALSAFQEPVKCPSES